MTANIFGPDLGYVVIIALVVLFGGSQLPKIARNIGSAGKEFRKAQEEAEAEEARRQPTAQAQPAVPSGPVAAPTAVSAAGAASAADQPSIRTSPAELDGVFKAGDDHQHREAG